MKKHIVSIISRVTPALTAVVSGALFENPASAQSTDLGAVMSNWNRALSNAPPLISTGALVLGGVIFVAGLHGLYMHHKNAQQHDMKTGVAGVIIGGALMTWVTIAGMTGNTFTGGANTTVTFQALPTP
jgi:hypothetical protein